MATRYLKKWLHLPRCATLSILYHPEVLGIPFIQHSAEKAKLSCLTSISSSLDPLISELYSCVGTVKDSMAIPEKCASIFTSVVKSTSTDTTHRCIKIANKSNSLLHTSHIDQWNAKLDELQVQSKFKDIVELEPQSNSWNRIISGLPVGQLSFLLRAGADCLPTPLNLRRWKLRVDAICDLCGSPAITHCASYP